MIQRSFLPDNDHEPAVRRASVPLVKQIDGRYLWKCIGADRYEPAPALEAALLAALARAEQRRAA